MLRLFLVLSLRSLSLCPFVILYLRISFLFFALFDLSVHYIFNNTPVSVSDLNHFKSLIVFLTFVCPALLSSLFFLKTHNYVNWNWITFDDLIMPWFARLEQTISRKKTLRIESLKHRNWHSIWVVSLPTNHLIWTFIFNAAIAMNWLAGCTYPYFFASATISQMTIMRPSIDCSRSKTFKVI